MTPRSRIGALLVVALVGSAGMGEAQAEPLESLAWMAGCWRADGEEGWTEEVWTAPAAGLLLGLSRSGTPRGGVGFEFMRIDAGAEGVVFHASPGGRPATAFPAVAVSGERLRVERPEHDFPRAIEYRRVGADSLVARVFGGVADAEPALALRFARVACPGGRP